MIQLLQTAAASITNLYPAIRLPTGVKQMFRYYLPSVCTERPSGQKMICPENALRAGIAQLLPGDGRIGLKLTCFCRLNRHETRHFQCRRYEKNIIYYGEYEMLTVTDLSIGWNRLQKQPISSFRNNKFTAGKIEKRRHQLGSGAERAIRSDLCADLVLRCFKDQLSAFTAEIKWRRTFREELYWPSGIRWYLISAGRTALGKQTRVLGSSTSTNMGCAIKGRYLIIVLEANRTKFQYEDAGLDLGHRRMKFWPMMNVKLSAADALVNSLRPARTVQRGFDSKAKPIELK
ncbi:hypothetical protein EVAR_50040_1 [Eumeta japonica]|uniref:Uncharacterized protein n=1 Tax=Eumeta variegata TaxID=151549 RepID=A0A4C1XKN6_EUMVA|nr:hypothetical protein EVAR_50040_1 [Eumeta japonica]